MTIMEMAQLLGNLGEFFGSIAVVATLVYLAIQIRHSSRQTETQIEQSQSPQVQNLHGRTQSSERKRRM